MVGEPGRCEFNCSFYSLKRKSKELSHIFNLYLFYLELQTLKMQTKTNNKNFPLSVIITVFMLSIAYTILRYHGFGNTPWSQFPVYVLNKALALTGFILLGINFSLGPLNNIGGGFGEKWLSIRPSLGVTSFLLIFTHLFLSLILLNPANYQKFFLENGSLTTNGGLSMLAGVIAFLFLWIYTISFQTFLREDKAFIKFITSRKVILVAMVFTAAHIFFMGYQGWSSPQNWPGGLPPITLISFVIFLITYIINLIGRK
jgi:DMSO/TMAO reductase YedYZ heme-binding membrane subunit